MFKWNQYEFIECFGVTPEVDEYEESHMFRISKHGLQLELTIFQYAGDVYINLYRDGLESPILNVRLTDCPSARYVVYKNGVEYMEFAPP